MSEDQKSKDEEFFDSLEYSKDFTEKEAKKAYKACATIEIKETLRRLEELKKHKVGAVLVRKNWGGDNYATMSDGTTKTKFVVIHKSEEGILFAKKYLQSGQLGKQLFNLSADSHKYEIDPDLVDHIILDEEDNYNPTEYITKMMAKKKELTESNKSLAFRWSIKSQRMELFNEMNIGDIYWVGYGYQGNDVAQYKVTEKAGTMIHLEAVDSSTPYWRKQMQFNTRYNTNTNFWVNKPKVLKDMLGATK